MRRRILVFTSIFSVALFGCAPTLLQKEARRVNMRASEYRDLMARANGGDRGAAESLAQLWYGEDNQKAEHWLRVAAEHGSANATRLADAVQRYQH